MLAGLVRGAVVVLAVAEGGNAGGEKLLADGRAVHAEEHGVLAGQFLRGFHGGFAKPAFRIDLESCHVVRHLNGVRSAGIFFAGCFGETVGPLLDLLEIPLRSVADVHPDFRFLRNDVVGAAGFKARYSEGRGAEVGLVFFLEEADLFRVAFPYGVEESDGGPDGIHAVVRISGVAGFAVECVLESEKSLLAVGKFIDA